MGGTLAKTGHLDADSRQIGESGGLEAKAVEGRQAASRYTLRDFAKPPEPALTAIQAQKLR